MTFQKRNIPHHSDCFTVIRLQGMTENSPH